MSKKYITQFFYAVLFFVVSCTSIEQDTMHSPTLSTKSFVDNEYALSEQEAVIKAEQFILEMGKVRQSNSDGYYNAYYSDSILKHSSGIIKNIRPQQ
jgi:hypothetical protein